MLSAVLRSSLARTGHDDKKTFLYRFSGMTGISQLLIRGIRGSIEFKEMEES